MKIKNSKKQKEKQRRREREKKIERSESQFIENETTARRMKDYESS